ncbi:MAG: hypothetical protein U5Q03_04640 [Bacteroidota bacterium]|nr:hypothetical protein [Bacteroidota bacterium]
MSQIDLDFEEHRPDSLTNIKKTSIDFQLHDSLGPGLYGVLISGLEKLKSGTIYLKAFEITQENSALSTSRLPQRSSIKINNRTER